MDAQIIGSIGTCIIERPNTLWLFFAGLWIITVVILCIKIEQYKKLKALKECRYLKVLQGFK